MDLDDYTPAALLDLDGTLVDSVYQHVLAWDEALRAHGHTVPHWRIHAAIGMGSQRLVPWLLGEQVPEAARISDAHEERFLARASSLAPTRGAAALLEDLDQREIAFLVATSAQGPISEALLEALGAGDLTTANADDVGSPKPAPDLLLAACAQLGVAPGSVTLVGDSPWDAEAGVRIGMRTIAVRCGGFGDAALRDAGAAAIVDDPRALVGRL